MAFIFHSTDQKTKERKFFDFFDVFNYQEVQFIIEDFFELEFLFDFQIFDGDFAFGEQFDFIFFIDIENLELDDVSIDKITQQIPDFKSIFFEFDNFPKKQFFFFRWVVFLFFGDENGDEFRMEIFFGNYAKNFVHC